MTVIDLDRSIDGPPEPDEAPRNRWRRMISVVGSLVIGAVGGYGVSHWQRRAQESTVAMLIFPGPISWEGGRTTTSAGSGKVESVVDLAGQVAIVNAGQKPVKVMNVFVDQRDLALRSNGLAGWISPGKATVTAVSVKVGCSSGRLWPIKVSLSVQTADKQLLELPSAVTLDGSGWQNEVQRACSAPFFQ
jgi:hypothetical protein